MTDDFIDKAMDAAESEIEATTEPVEPVETEPTEDLVETQEMAKAITPEKKQRTKFEKLASQDTEEAEPVEAAAEPPQEPPSDLPEFWPADLKALASKAPKEVLQKFKEYDQQRTEWANRVAGESSKGKQIEQKMSEVYEPYRQKLAMAGIRDPLEATSRVLAWNEMLTSDNVQERKNAISILLRQGGLTPQDLLEEYAQTEPDQYSEAMAAAQAARDELEEFKRSQASERANQEIASFRAGKDSTGADREPLVRMFEPQIADALIEIRKLRPDLPTTEQLHHAYEFVIGEARKSGHLAQPQQRAPAGKALAAASSVTGSPGTAVAAQRSRAKGKTFDDKLNSALDEALDSAGY